MFSSNILLISYMFLFKNSTCQHFLPSVYCLHEVFRDWSAILTKNIAGSSGIELPILFASIESIDTFVSIDDFDTFSIVSPITRSRWRDDARKERHCRQCCFQIINIFIDVNIE